MLYGVLGILNCNCCDTAVRSAQFLRIDLYCFQIINNLWTCRHICIILVSFERKMNALYKSVKFRIPWKVSVWPILAGRVTYVECTGEDGGWWRLWLNPVWEVNLCQEFRGLHLQSRDTTSVGGPEAKKHWSLELADLERQTSLEILSHIYLAHDPEVTGLQAQKPTNGAQKWCYFTKVMLVPAGHKSVRECPCDPPSEIKGEQLHPCKELCGCVWRM